ncbi:MAG: hypothetical protein KF896_03675 [Ignavibacteriae bacterium]|nr:hypothetical protein [Ignavibacteriota bacterium]
MKIKDGIEKIGPQSYGVKNYYVRQSSNKSQPRLKHFRVGEILQGTILTTDGNGTGLVRLPSGDFNCYLHKGLKKGDELFFKITSVEPGLVIKVHAVQSFFKRVKRKKEDIVRILDLPQDDIYYYTADIYLTFKNMIYKDDLLNFYKFYERVPNNNVYDVEALSRTLFWLSESGISFEFDIFSTSYKYFYGMKYMDSYISSVLLKKFSELPENLKAILNPFRMKYYNSKNEPNLGVDFLSVNSETQGLNFYTLMKKLSSSQLFDNNEYLTGRISDFIQSMYFWNTICTGSDAAYHWTFPFMIAGKTKLITLVVRSQFNIRRMMGISTGSYEDIDVGNIFSIIFNRHSNELKNYFDKSPNIKQILEIFEKYLSESGLKLLAIHYYDDELITVESAEGAVISTNRSISFVV